MVIAAVVVGTLVLHLGKVNESAAGKIDTQSNAAMDNLGGLEVPGLDGSDATPNPDPTPDPDPEPDPTDDGNEDDGLGE